MQFKRLGRIYVSECDCYIISPSWVADGPEGKRYTGWRGPKLPRRAHFAIIRAVSTGAWKQVTAPQKTIDQARELCAAHLAQRRLVATQKPCPQEV